MIQIGTFENWNHLKTCHFEIRILNVLGRVKAIYSDSLTLLNQVLASLAVLYKYAHILLFQFVFTKYVFCFRNYDRLIFVVFDIYRQSPIFSLVTKKGILANFMQILIFSILLRHPVAISATIAPNLQKMLLKRNT